MPKNEANTEEAYLRLDRCLLHPVSTWIRIGLKAWLTSHFPPYLIFKSLKLHSVSLAK